MIDRAAPVRETLRKVIAGVAAAVVVVVLVVSGRLQPLEGWALGKFFDLRGARPPSAPIVIVTIDESSIQELGAWPFPRATHARLLSRIREGNPIAIGFDVIFDTPSSRGPGDDRPLSEAVARAGNVVLGCSRTIDDQGFYLRESFNVPTPEIRRGAAAVAPVNVFPDADGVVRRAPLAVAIERDTLPAFDVALYRLAVNAGLRAAPLPVVSASLINFRGGPNTFPWVPYYRVVTGEISPETFTGKIVLIGQTTEVQHDVFQTAFAPGGDMPGVEIHANAIDTYLHGDRIREAPRWLTIALVVLEAIVASAFVARLHALRALFWCAVVGVLLLVAEFLAFSYGTVWVHGMAGTVALVLGYGTTTVEQYVREQREKRRLSQFFSPDVLRHVVRETGMLGSHRRLVTVLFSDLRGFTTMSEKLEPEQVAEILHEYLTDMTEIVFKHGGTVDKYIGDCVMALYNAPFEDPDHAAKAIRTGLEFQEKTLEVSRRWEEKLGVKIRNGVGINTGDAVVGTLGSRQRLEYTAIGDTINLGARLESITKDYGASIIISESTYEYVKGQFLTRELGAVTVKGKTQPVKIFAVLPDDLRAHPRTLLDAAATVTAIDAERECTVHVHDLSEGGIAVDGLPEDWTKGKQIEVRCEGGGLPKAVVAEGTIVWRRGTIVGIQFIELDRATAAAVADYVSTHRRSS